MRAWPVWILVLCFLGCLPSMRKALEPLPHPEPPVIPDTVDTGDTVDTEDTGNLMDTGDLPPCVLYPVSFTGHAGDLGRGLGFIYQACINPGSTQWESSLTTFFHDKLGQPVCGETHEGTYIFEVNCPTCDRAGHFEWEPVEYESCEILGLPPLHGTPVQEWGIDLVTSKLWMAEFISGIGWEWWITDVTIQPRANGMLFIRAYN